MRSTALRRARLLAVLGLAALLGGCYYPYGYYGYPGGYYGYPAYAARPGVFVGGGYGYGYGRWR